MGSSLLKIQWAMDEMRMAYSWLRKSVHETREAGIHHRQEQNVSKSLCVGGFECEAIIIIIIL